MSTAPRIRILLAGLTFGESPRWHGGRLWVSDWGAKEVVAVDLGGNKEVVVQVAFPSFPMCMEWLPDGRLLVVSSRDGQLLRRETDGALVRHADLSGLADKGHPWNEIVVDGRGNAYINSAGFDAQGAVWYGDVPNKRCVRVREGGEMLQTIDLDRGCFACILGGAGRSTLFMVVTEWHGTEHMADGTRTGQVLTTEAPAPGAGWP